MTALRTARKIALAVLIVILTATVTSRWWTLQIGRSLVCTEDISRSDALLVENFDPTYVLFERAAELTSAGVAPTALIPVAASSQGVVNPISSGIAEVMARHARLRAWRVIPVIYTEPFSLNAALQIRQRLIGEGIRSIVVVAPGFRSRRSVLVYRATLGTAGIEVRCSPAFNRATPENWTETSHGIMDVAEESLKLQYYRLYILPFRAPRTPKG